MKALAYQYRESKDKRGTVKHVIVDGLDISYDVLGSNKPILMIHGWGSNSLTYADLAKKVSASHKVILIDLPGFGSSQTPSVAWDLKKYAEFLEKFLKKIGVDNLYGLIGHSLGGRIAIYAQSHGKLNSDRLILLASHGIASQRDPRVLAFKILSKTGKAVSQILPKSKRESLKRNLYQKAGSTDYLNTSPAMKGTFLNIIKQDLKADAKNIPTKTLLIYGSKDDMTPVKFGELFDKAIPDSKLKIIPEAGHYVHLDYPQEVTKLTEDFLR